jgi:hypothetical protein
MKFIAFVSTKGGIGSTTIAGVHQSDAACFATLPVLAFKLEFRSCRRKLPPLLNIQHHTVAGLQIASEP